MGFHWQTLSEQEKQNIFLPLVWGLVLILEDICFLVNGLFSFPLPWTKFELIPLMPATLLGYSEIASVFSFIFQRKLQWGMLQIT